MPNTPALVAEGITAISAGTHASAADLDVAEALLAPVGRVVRVPESQLDAVTAISGSGPAYFFFLVESMIEAGLLLGLPRQLAAELVVQTAVGSAIMLRDSGEHPVQLREAVTSPGGTTIAAIRELEVHGVRAAVIAAIEAAGRRSAELGQGLLTTVGNVMSSDPPVRAGFVRAVSTRLRTVLSAGRNPVSHQPHLYRYSPQSTSV